MGCRVKRRAVAREDDSALETFGGLQIAVEPAFGAAHCGWTGVALCQWEVRKAGFDRQTTPTSVQATNQGGESGFERVLKR